MNKTKTNEIAPALSESREKTALLVFNPVAGAGTALRVMPALVRGLTESGYICTVVTTTKKGDGTEAVLRSGRGMDRVICSGGDGTVSEVINGLMEIPADERPEFGYIPAGSTNDFANSLALPKRSKEAVALQTAGSTIPTDIGRFNEKHFVYVCAFGAFTSVSYSTSQTAKNVFRSFAYYAKSIDALKQISPIRARFLIDGVQVEDSFVFCSVSNARVIGGFVRLRKPDVSLNDGLFEVVLIRYPEDALGFTKIINAITSRNLSCEYIRVFQAKQVEITLLDGPVDFTLDGECEPAVSHALVTNIPSAVRIAAKEAKPKDRS